MVDEFYDRNVKLIISAEVELKDRYTGGRLNFEFQRTLSRCSKCNPTSSCRAGTSLNDAVDQCGSELAREERERKRVHSGLMRRIGCFASKLAPTVFAGSGRLLELLAVLVWRNSVSGGTARKETRSSYPLIN